MRFRFTPSLRPWIWIYWRSNAHAHAHEKKRKNMPFHCENDFAINWPNFHGEPHRTRHDTLDPHKMFLRRLWLRFVGEWANRKRSRRMKKAESNAKTHRSTYLPKTKRITFLLGIGNGTEVAVGGRSDIVRLDISNLPHQNAFGRFQTGALLRHGIVHTLHTLLLVVNGNSVGFPIDWKHMRRPSMNMLRSFSDKHIGLVSPSFAFQST